MRTLQVGDNPTRLAQAIAEFGRIDKTLHTLNMIDDGPDHPKVAIHLNNLAALLQDTNRLSEAEPLMRRALLVLLKFTHETGHLHPDLSVALKNSRGNRCRVRSSKL
jgi:hypothetical protein